MNVVLRRRSAEGGRGRGPFSQLNLAQPTRDPLVRPSVRPIATGRNKKEADDYIFEMVLNVS